MASASGPRWQLRGRRSRRSAPATTPHLRWHVPTEAQWEEAARGGLVGALYPWGDRQPEIGNCDFNGLVSASVLPSRTFPANGYGLFSMSGGVWEWCTDWYDANYFRESSYCDPAGPPGGGGRRCSAAVHGRTVPTPSRCHSASPRRPSLGTDRGTRPPTSAGASVSPGPTSTRLSGVEYRTAGHRRARALGHVRAPDCPPVSRNRVIHGYDQVDFDILWAIVTGDWPPLITSLRKIISAWETNLSLNVSSAWRRRCSSTTKRVARRFSRA